MNKLESKTAVVTGGAQGIGRGIALELARAGANVVVADLDKGKAEMVVAEVKALGTDAIALPLDVTNTASTEVCVKKSLKHFPRIDILINNAGVFQQGIETTMGDFDICYEVNLKGVWRVSQAFIPHFKANQNGKIVNTSSIAGRCGIGPFSAYSSSKAAVISLTQSLASTLGADNINVNAVCPGVIWTPMMGKIEGIVGETNDTQQINQRDHFLASLDHMALKRHQTPADIGYAVAFLVSEQAKNITGQALNVDSGYFMN